MREVPDLGIPDTIVIILALVGCFAAGMVRIKTVRPWLAHSHPSLFGESFPLAVFAATTVKLRIQSAPKEARDEKIRERSQNLTGGLSQTARRFSAPSSLLNCDA